jgi:glutamate--cysteine ligase
MGSSQDSDMSASVLRENEEVSMSTTPLTEDETLTDWAAVHGHVARICFKTGPPTGLGAEIEMLVGHLDDPRRPVSLPILQQLLSAAELPGQSRLTFEPGGQVELSSPVFSSLDACVAALGVDLSHVTGRLHSAGCRPLATAVEPLRRPVRQLQSERYDAMELYFDGLGPRQAGIGRTMMTSTAALQVNLDCGVDEVQVRGRWELLRALGPVLVASFANSPRHRGRPTGWKSTRARVWNELDPGRTSWPPTSLHPVEAYAELALDARVMVLCDSSGWRSAPGFTFREWVAGVPGVRPPTVCDLDYHLSTLFPPVRARGWYEIRYIDAQPPGLWPVPIAVVWALLQDPWAREGAAAAVEPVADQWSVAAREGLADPGLHAAARQCFEAALAGLARMRCSDALVTLVERFADEYVDRGRCPADDLANVGPAPAVNGQSVVPVQVPR